MLTMWEEKLLTRYVNIFNPLSLSLPFYGSSSITFIVVSAVQFVKYSFVKNVSGNIHFVAIKGSQHDHTECGLTSGK